MKTLKELEKKADKQLLELKEEKAINDIVALKLKIKKATRESTGQRVQELEKRLKILLEKDIESVNVEL